MLTLLTGWWPLFLVILEHLKSELAVAKERVDDDLLSNVNGVKINRSKKFRLESQLESQIATYDKEMTALRVDLICEPLRSTYLFK